MPLKVEAASYPNESGFKLWFSEPGAGRGFGAQARTPKEVSLAIEHYWPSRAKTRRHVPGSRKDCPLCREMNK